MITIACNLLKLRNLSLNTDVVYSLCIKAKIVIARFWTLFPELQMHDTEWVHNDVGSWQFALRPSFGRFGGLAHWCRWFRGFYHCFKVSRDHSLRNHIHGVFPGDTFKGGMLGRLIFLEKWLLVVFGTLAMGNSFAVELAQHTHTNLLSRAGVLKEAEQVCYRKPLPRSSTLQLLCIDDLAVLQKVPRGISASSSKCFRGDRELLEKAGNAYADAGLRTSAKKAVRDADTATILGGELDGRRGILSAPRLRIVTLSRLTLQLVKIGWATKNLMEVIIGSWIFVLLFRRPLLALFNDVFPRRWGL